MYRQKHNKVGISNKIYFLWKCFKGGLVMKDMTKKLIAEKMRILIRKKPLEKIRIREICEAAEVDRSTFYYHFKDKYDLVTWIYFHEIRDLNVLESSESVRGLKGLKKDAALIRNSLTASAQNSLTEYMKEFYIGYYINLLKNKTGLSELDEGLVFSVRLFCYGAVDMMVEWILNSGAVTAEEYTRMVYRSMPEEIHRICFS